MEKDWKWYWGRNNETYEGGPFDTRAAAVKEARTYEIEAFYIVEARQEGLNLSLQFEADLWLEDTDDALYDTPHMGDPDGYGLFADVTHDQIMGLQASVRKAITNWQKRNKLVFEPFYFTETRNEECVKGQQDEQ